MFRAGLLIVGVAACGFEVQGTSPDASVDAALDAPVVDTLIDASAPTCVALEVAAGGEHTCARTEDGSVHCWGRGAYGELGSTQLQHRCTVAGISYYCSPTPVPVQLPEASSLGLGSYHSCATTASGTYCWGANLHGAYGDGTTAGQSTPRLIPERTGATRIEGGAYHTCSLAGSTVACSGQNAAGEIGDNSQVAQPTSTPVMSDAVALALGEYTTCGINTQQQLVCWGRNTQGQIDTGLRNKLTPYVIPGLAGVVHAASGRDFTCAVLGDETARCWGSNAYGQLGNGTTSQFVQPPQAVQVPNLVAISAERYHACALTEAGGVHCFGEGYGAEPVAIALPRPARSITSGSAHDCAITEDGRAYCWGNQEFGQLGDGSDHPGRTLTPRLVPLCE